VREGTTSRVMAADRPCDEFYNFYSVSPEDFEYHLVCMYVCVCVGMYVSCMYTYLSANVQLWITFRSYHYTQSKIYILDVRPDITFLHPLTSQRYLNIRGDVQSDRKPAVPLSEAEHISKGMSQRMNAQYHSGSAELEAGGTT
jgi:hypothetical protein